MLAQHNCTLFYPTLAMVCFHQNNMKGTMLFNVNKHLSPTSLCVIVVEERGTPGKMDYLGRFCPNGYLFQDGASI